MQNLIQFDHNLVLVFERLARLINRKNDKLREAEINGQRWQCSRNFLVGADRGAGKRDLEGAQ